MAWERWFAWRPVWIMWKERIVWLRWVERKMFDDHFGPQWRYRLPPAPQTKEPK